MAKNLVFFKEGEGLLGGTRCMLILLFFLFYFIFYLKKLVQ